MGSSFFGEGNNWGNDQRGSGSFSSSSSRRGKKSSNNSEKPKQPQRGLGVAQLEKIRLHGQVGANNCVNYNYPSLQTPNYATNFNNEDIMRVQAPYSSTPSSSFSYSTSSSSSASNYNHPNFMMAFGEGDQRANVSYGTDTQAPASTTISRWDPKNNIMETQHFLQPNMTRHLLDPILEDSTRNKSKKHRSDSRGSSSQNSESSETQELDLELRLSL